MPINRNPCREHRIVVRSVELQSPHGVVQQSNQVRRFYAWRKVTNVKLALRLVIYSWLRLWVVLSILVQLLLGSYWLSYHPVRWWCSEVAWLFTVISAGSSSSVR